MGVDTARKVIQELNATNYKIVDAERMDHVDAVIGIDIRCYYLNDVMLTFKRLENERDGEHERYREKVDTFVKSLGFEDGCIGKRNDTRLDEVSNMDT